VAQTRRRCVAVRFMTRTRRRGGSCTNGESLYKQARATLCKLITKAKSDAWEIFIKSLDDDPWGLPYKLVMDRLRQFNVALTETLEPETAEKLLDDCFPTGEVHDPEITWRNWNGFDPELWVTAEEVREAIRGRRRSGCPAPGLDGFSLTIWRCVSSVVVEYLASLYTLCLEKGKIPKDWKKAILVLIPKGKIDINASKARPICLLNDIGKFFERIIDRRLKTHLNTLPRLRAPS